jgi:hypothetical protein
MLSGLFGPLLDRLGREHVQVLLLTAGVVLIVVALALPHQHRLNVVKALV